MSIGIAMTTYERPDYFQRALNSLEKSDVNLDNFVIFDDKSKNKDKINILKKLPYDVHINKENLGTTLNTIHAIDYLYKKFDPKYLILLQDDILFSKSWLKKGIEIFEKIKLRYFNIAYFCLYNRDIRDEEEYYIHKYGHPGLVAWIIDRKWWELYRERYSLDDYMVEFFKGNNAREKHHKLNVVDYKLTLRIYGMRWNVAKVGKSLIQHIGDKSSLLGGKDMTFCRSRNFVGENV